VVLSAAERERVKTAGAGAGAVPALDERHCFALPILLGPELGGVVAVGYDQPHQPAAEEAALLRDLADRIAVALMSARRDEELERRANYDALTGLPNRLLGTEALAHAVAAAGREGRLLAVLFADLDGFADVNDSSGHAAGDQVLVQAAERLRGCVRKSDFIARLGGDEFALVLTEVSEPAGAAVVASNVIEAVSRGYSLGATDVFISASVGIAIYPNDGASADELLRHADLAMYRAKQSGRRQFAFFEPSMNEEVRRRRALASELRGALENHQFELHFQPQLDLRTGAVVGAEALIRWRHPSRGILLPSHFIPFAESSALIEDIGHWALGAAGTQFVAWQGAGLSIEYLSVNVSARQLQKPGFATIVQDVLRQTQMPAAALHLELTESAVLDTTRATTANLNSLVDLGVVLELDDFGTGYSSLAHLQRLPVSTVKLDRAFIRTIESSAGTQAVVEAAIDMVHALGKNVVAEGVEYPGQKAVLARLGCDLMQGYLLSTPLPAAEFIEFVGTRQRESTAPAAT
jgi:diguanylate cyclase (GGDEF)-like protein